MKKILTEGEHVEIRIMGRAHFLVIVGILLVVFFALRAEVILDSQKNRQAIGLQDTKIENLTKQVQTLQEQQSSFCLQYEADMDRFFREHPEFNHHPWLCGK